MEHPADVAPQGALNGWKEIAGYLGKSPRTVQRWERDLGLPVRRIPTPDGGAIIFAVRAELETWRADRQERDADPDDARGGDTLAAPPAGATLAATTLAAPEPMVPPDPFRGAAVPLPEAPLKSAADATTALGQRQVPMWLAALVSVTIGALGVWIGVNLPVSGVPTTWEHDGRLLRTFTQGGRPLWNHDFGRPVVRPAQFTREGSYAVDVNGDAVPELIVPVRYSPTVTETSAESDAVVAFDRQGRIVWRVQPTLVLRGGSQTFNGPWYAYDVISGVTPEGPRTWVAFNHHTWWPGFVIEVDPAGRQRVFAMMAGRIHGLTFWRTPSRGLLIAAGALRSTETGTEAAGMFADVGAAPVTWPADGPEHLDCEGCPSADPLTVIRLPASHVERALILRPAYMFRGKETPLGLQLPVREQFGRGTIVTVTPSLDVLHVDRTDLYWTAHAEDEASRLIGHTADACPDRTHDLPVFTWTRASGWDQRLVPAAPGGAAVSTSD